MDGRDAACFFRLLRFLFPALCLSASNSQLAFLTDERPLSQSKTSCCHDLCKLSLQLVFVTLSWSTTIALSFLEHAEEECFGYAYVSHPCDVASPVQLHLEQGGLYAGQAGSPEDFFA